MIIWLASYPKSGNTWIRSFIISLMLKKRKKLKLEDLENIKQFPTKSQYLKNGININYNNFDEVSKYWIQVQSRINSDKKIRFFKTHNSFCKKGDSLFTNSKNTLGVIHIVRDPRNIISSIKNHYHHDNLEESKKFIFDETRGIFVKNPEKSDFALPQVLGSWQTHYNSWKKIDKNYLLIKYENLIKNPEEEFRKVVNYLNKLIRINFDEEHINNAINCTSFEKLKNLEDLDGFSESRVDERTGQRKKFFFLGPKNDWRQLIDEKIAYSIEKKFKKEMNELGYI